MALTDRWYAARRHWRRFLRIFWTPRWIRKWRREKIREDAEFEAWKADHAVRLAAARREAMPISEPSHDEMTCQGNGAGHNEYDDPCWNCIGWAFGCLEILRTLHPEIYKQVCGDD